MLREGGVAAWTADRLAAQDAERREYLERHIRETKPDPAFQETARETARRGPRSPIVARAGDRFADWTVIAYARTRAYRGRYDPLYLCRCACGAEHEVSLWSLRGGKTHRCKACGMAKARGSKTRASA